ncbi:hypothetical protein [Spirillospora sp. NPDC047279]|uniref:hypothetical protein n=1 Tax=Spirillospora sp. NPDC047279 TaxID=3155478 RepID=UPI0033EB8462
MDVPPPAETAARRADDPDLVIAAIELRFPGWSAWRSDTDRWWAFRTAADPLTIEELRAGHRLIVQADTPEELHAAIRAEIDSAAGADPGGPPGPGPGVGQGPGPA